MSYEIVSVGNSKGTYTSAKPYEKSFGLTPNDAALMNIVVFVDSIVGGSATATVTMDESYDGGQVWFPVAVTNASITVAGQFKLSPNSASILGPLVRLVITPAIGVTLKLSDVKRTRIASGAIAVKSNSSGGSGSGSDTTEATQLSVLAKVTAIDTNTKQSTLGIPLHDAIVPSYPSTSVEVYQYKVGGLAGATVATTTVTYTDATKTVLVSVVRT
jgi:hypothetical protein